MYHLDCDFSHKLYILFSSFAEAVKKMPVDKMKVPQLRNTLVYFKQDKNGKRAVLVSRLKWYLSTKFHCDTCDTNDWYECCCLEVVEMLEEAEKVELPSNSNVIPTPDGAETYIPDTYLTCTECENWLDCNCVGPEPIPTETLFHASLNPSTSGLNPESNQQTAAAAEPSKDGQKRDKKTSKAEGIK
jgi:hypothetical protein